MEINNRNALWNLVTNHSTASIDSSDSSETNSFSDMLTTLKNSKTDDYMKEMTAFAVEELAKKPDLASMSREDFLAHLREVQDFLVEMGVDASEMNDPNALTMEELDSLQYEMQQPPTPLPMELMNFNFVDYSKQNSNVLDSLLGYL